MDIIHGSAVSAGRRYCLRQVRKAQSPFEVKIIWRDTMSYTVRKPRLGVLALGRSTFDTEFAAKMHEQALKTLADMDAELVGGKEILYGAAALEAALPAIEAADVDALLVIQVTFTDAESTVAAALKLGKPVIMWSWAEARTGGRLLLNSFCGVNLASHALSRHGKSIVHVHKDSSDPEAAKEIFHAAQAASVLNQLKGQKFLLIGEHPDGFDACNFNPNDLFRLFGMTTDHIDILDFIEETKAQPDSVADAPYARRAAQFPNLGELDHDATIKTCKIYARMRDKAAEQGYLGMTVRCWPHFFTHYGAAACGAMAMMNEDGVPCGCEGDLYGVLTALLLTRLQNSGAFNTDLVDVDVKDDTVVFWHCGQAPIDMADPEGPIRGTIHSNRKLPLLSEFCLKPGRFTLARISQGKGKLRLLIGGGEMISRPLAFSGTAGVARMDIPAEQFMKNLIAEGMEHHSGIVYGDCREQLKMIAEMVGLEVVDLTKA